MNVGATMILSAGLLYLLSTIVYGTYLLRFTERYARVALLFMALGWAVNVSAAVMSVSSQGFVVASFDLLLVAPCIAVGIYLLTLLRNPNPLIGAFLAPIATMTLYSLHVFGKFHMRFQHLVIELSPQI